MEKIFARLTPWNEYTDVSAYFDLSTECNGMGLNIVGLDRYTASFFSEDWKKLKESLDTVAYYLRYLNPKNTDGTFYRTVSEVLDDYLPGWENGKKRSSRLIHAWKEAIFDADSNGFDGEPARVLLELYTGYRYSRYQIHGSCQGDFAEIFFPSSEDVQEEEKYRRFVEALYFGTGWEVCVHEGEEEPNEPDEVDGVWDYIPIPYATEDQCKEYLARHFGDKETTAADVTLWVPTEKHTIVRCDYKTA